MNDFVHCFCDIDTEKKLCKQNTKIWENRTWSSTNKNQIRLLVTLLNFLNLLISLIFDEINLKFQVVFIC